MWNYGGAYNMQTGVFTAPVDGLYQFNLNTGGASAGDKNFHISAFVWYPNMTTITEGQGTGPVRHTTSINPTVNMKAGQTLAVALAGGTTINDHQVMDTNRMLYDPEGLRFNQLSGYLLRSLV